MEDEIKNHYSGLLQEYIDQYDPDCLDTIEEYPANYFRLKLLKKLLEGKAVNRLLDIGAGSGVPLIILAKHLELQEVVGFDFTKEMVRGLKRNLNKSGIQDSYAFQGDANNPRSFEKAVKDGKFDAALMLGVMPHINNDIETLKNLRGSLVAGGRAYVSFRNRLFNLFSMNRLTHEFVLEDLLSGVDSSIRNITSHELKNRLAMGKPTIRRVNSAGGIGYDQILAKTHNPLEASTLFRAAGFKEVSIHWYHFHATLPWLEGGAVSKELFRSASISLEGSDDWRGNFLCSAYVVEATA
jgi:SAM-dependent methyltransferase